MLLANKFTQVFLSAPYQQTNSSKLQYPLNDFPVCLSNFSVLLEELILFAFLASSWRPILIKLTTASRAFRLQSRCQSIPGLFSSFNTSIFYLYSAPSYFKSPPLSITTSSRLKFVIFKIQKKKNGLITTKTLEIFRSVSCLTKIVIEILPPG